ATDERYGPLTRKVHRLIFAPSPPGRGRGRDGPPRYLGGDPERRPGPSSPWVGESHGRTRTRNGGGSPCPTRPNRCPAGHCAAGCQGGGAVPGPAVKRRACLPIIP